MRAAVLNAYGEPLEIEEVPDPTPDDDGIIVDVEACGICRSDWHAWRGEWEWAGARPPLGHILGHEPAGTVAEIGASVSSFEVGDRVVIPFNVADGTCPMCRRGRSNHCENRHGLGFSEEVQGAFAEQVHAPRADVNVVMLPDDVSPVEMAGLGCRFMTAFQALVHRADITAGDRIAIHGCGGVGLSAVDIGTALGAGVVAVDLSDEKLSMATDLGASETVNASEVDDVPGRIRELTEGGADVAVDALGIAETCQNAARSLDRLGQHVQIGLTSREEEGWIDLPIDELVRKEVTFVGSHGMPQTRYDRLLQMVERGQLDPSALVTNRVALEDVSDCLEAMTNYGTIGIEVITEF